MKDIIDLLLILENEAAEIYSLASVIFSNNIPLYKLLIDLEKDEIWHKDIIINADEFYKENKIKLNADIRIDAALKEKLVNPFIKIRELINNKSITEEIFINSLIESERSEWNYIFIYCISTIFKYDPKYKKIAAKIEEHLLHIENEIRKFPDNKNYLKLFSGINKIWDRKILIIDDSEAVRKFLINIFKKNYVVHEAENGQIAYDMINKNYYNVIISDIDMPVMNGIQLYENLHKLNINFAPKYIFITGSSGHSDFLRENNLVYFEKPFSIIDIENEVADKFLKK